MLLFVSDSVASVWESITIRYIIYRSPLMNKKKINESEASIVYSPFVVFEYAGGAIGSQNFIGKDEY